MQINIEPLYILFLTIVSFSAGVIDSIAGGGGILMIPALLFAGVTPQTALGTNKLASTCGTAVASYNFIISRKVLWKTVLTGIPFTLAGSSLGTKSVLYLDNAAIGKLFICSYSTCSDSCVHQKR